MSAKMNMDPDCKVYVGELGNHATEEEIYEAFSHFGKIKAVWVARKPPGFAFVEFYDTHEAADSVKSLNNRFVCGRRIKAEMCNGKSRWPTGKPPSHLVSKSPSGQSHSARERVRSRTPPKRDTAPSPIIRSRSRSSVRKHWKRERSDSRRDGKQRSRSSSTSSSASSKSSTSRQRNVSNNKDRDEQSHSTNNYSTRDVTTDTHDLEDYDDYLAPAPKVSSLAMVPHSPTDVYQHKSTSSGTHYQPHSYSNYRTPSRGFRPTRGTGSLLLLTHTG